MNVFPPDSCAPLRDAAAAPYQAVLNHRSPGSPSPCPLRVSVWPAGSLGYQVEVDGIGLTLDAPQRLEPAVVVKPWGREIWYTGHEVRGESRVAGAGGSISLYAYLGLAPARLCGRQPLILLKVLAPGSQPVRDELYCEVHAHKHEVYVVTEVDRGAYPDGRGSMRLGINQAKRARYAHDDAFRRGFLDAVEDYEEARRDADASGRAVTRQEAAARARVLEFTAEVSLLPGDVIDIPPGVPHGLQHGVRVIEFQTPSYERQIVYASQPVLTQGSWDSAAAIASMSLDDAPRRTPTATDHVQVLTETPDFQLMRIDLQQGASWALPPAAYAVAIATAGTVAIRSRQGSVSLEAGAAAFVPGSAADVAAAGVADGQLLLAVPRPNDG